MFDWWNNRFNVNDMLGKHEWEDLYRFSHIYRSDSDGKWRLVIVNDANTNKRLSVVLEPQGDLLVD